MDRLGEVGGLRQGLSRPDAVETMWLLMEPALFVRLTRDRGRTTAQYRAWVARAVRSLILLDHADLKEES